MVHGWTVDHAHAEYWNIDSASLRNMARIALGREPEAMPDDENARD
ncbi:hypothetical protein [Saccharomonospora sp. CUA-673]|nr:hypothetical protein [Saccharomonospora sp. CUA-673]